MSVSPSKRARRIAYRTRYARVAIKSQGELMLRNLRARHPRLADFLQREMKIRVRRKDRVMSESER